MMIQNSLAHEMFCTILESVVRNRRFQTERHLDGLEASEGLPSLVHGNLGRESNGGSIHLRIKIDSAKVPTFSGFCGALHAFI